MPRNIAQWTGFAVTIIIVLGRDADVLTAVPLGIAAGMLAMLFQEGMRTQVRPARLLVRWRAFRQQADGTSAAPKSYRPKWRHAQFRE